MQTETESQKQTRTLQGYRVLDVPHTCEFCDNLNWANEFICSLGKFPVELRGTCNYRRWNGK